MNGWWPLVVMAAFFVASILWKKVPLQIGGTIGLVLAALFLAYAITEPGKLLTWIFFLITAVTGLRSLFQWRKSRP